MDIGKIVRRIEVDPAESPDVPAGPIGEPAAAPSRSPGTGRTDGPGQRSLSAPSSSLRAKAAKPSWSVPTWWNQIPS